MGPCIHPWGFLLVAGFQPEYKPSECLLIANSITVSQTTHAVTCHFVQEKAEGNHVEGFAEAKQKAEILRKRTRTLH